LRLCSRPSSGNIVFSLCCLASIATLLHHDQQPECCTTPPLAKARHSYASLGIEQSRWQLVQVIDNMIAASHISTLQFHMAGS
jgi:hypothetical protein